MTPETQKWISEVKERREKYQPNDMLKHAWDDLPRAIEIIEQQAKALEKAKEVLSEIAFGIATNPYWTTPEQIKKRADELMQKAREALEELETKP